MIGSPLSWKNSASPPPPDRSCGRGGRGPCTITSAAKVGDAVICMPGRRINIQAPDAGALHHHAPAAAREFACPSLDLIEITGRGLGCTLETSCPAAIACWIQTPSEQRDALNVRMQPHAASPCALCAQPVPDPSTLVAVRRGVGGQLQFA